MEQFYIIKKQSKEEDRKAIKRLIIGGVAAAGIFYGSMLLFLEFIIYLDKFSKWLF